MCATKDFTFKHGDTFPARQITLKQKDGSGNITPIPLWGAQIDMQVRSKPGAEIIENFTTTDATIKIIDDAGGVFRIESRKITGEPGNYQYDLQVTFDDAQHTVKTYFGGQFIIQPDITQV